MQVQSKLFTKFATNTDMAGGTGLGLFISKSIIESHGGRMWATNNNNGEKTGATFSFTLPLTTEKIQSDSEQEGTSKH
jgi:two-component system sensor histidine kinase VicK